MTQPLQIPWPKLARNTKGPPAGECADGKGREKFVYSKEGGGTFIKIEKRHEKPIRISDQFQSSWRRETPPRRPRRPLPTRTTSSLPARRLSATPTSPGTLQAPRPRLRESRPPFRKWRLEVHATFGGQYNFTAIVDKMIDPTPSHQVRPRLRTGLCRVGRRGERDRAARHHDLPALQSQQPRRENGE